VLACYDESLNLLLGFVCVVDWWMVEEFFGWFFFGWLRWLLSAPFD
jgi:hypothetical protein